MKRLAALIILVPSFAYGWGATGHQVICQIAFDELTAPAKIEVRRLLRLDADFSSFAESCLFADVPERIRPSDHFINVPRSFQAITTDDCPTAETCLFPAIESDLAVLRGDDASDREKLTALKLLGHWAGDIHQPLHVSYEDDRGANHIRVNGGDPDDNLHETWDYLIIEERMGGDFRQIATDLRAAVSDEERAAWMHDSPVEWANESYRIAISPPVGYCVAKQGACWYSSQNMILNDGEPMREMTVTGAYLAAHEKTVARRLQQAGIRLAALLNGIFE